MSEPTQDFPSAPPESPAPLFELDQCLIYQCVGGARAYGWEDEDSDTDRLGIYLAPPALQWSLFGAPDQFEDHAGRSRYWELQTFLILALEAEVEVLECLYSPMVERVTPLGEQLLALRERLLSQRVFATFNRRARLQQERIERGIQEHRDVPWNDAANLLRLLLTGAVTLREGRVPVRVEAHRERLLAVNQGEIPWADAEQWRKELHADLEEALAGTCLPERPDYEAANDLLLQARFDNVIRHSDSNGPE